MRARGGSKRKSLQKQVRAVLGTHTEHLREIVTRSPLLTHHGLGSATAGEGRVGAACPRAPLAEQVRARGGAECNDPQQAGPSQRFGGRDTERSPRHSGDTDGWRGPWTRAPLVEQMRARGGAESDDLQQPELSRARTQTERLRESVTRSPLSHITAPPVTACEDGLAWPVARAPLVEQVRAGGEC